MKRIIQSSLSLLLCAVILCGVIPTVYAANGDTRLYNRLADLAELESQYLSDSEERAAQYPNGAMMIVETSAEFEMSKTYAIDIFRQGGTKDEASVKLSTVDLSAGYGEAYRLYLSDSLKEPAVEGKKQLYYYETGVPYVARLTEQQTYYMTQDNVDDLDAAKQDASEINDMSADSMPHSTESVLTFAPGEDKKTVYVEILTPKAVTDDLEFMLVLSEPENCSISASTSGMYKICEKREKSKAALELVSSSVNPENGEAYISVKRSGNLGGYDSFRLTTQSGTAKAEEDYVAVAEDLRFIPNLSEIKVPVTILDGAQDGESFTAELSDLSDNAVAKNTTATVTFDTSKAVEPVGEESKKYVTAFTFKTNNNRNYEFVDVSKFKGASCLSDWSDATVAMDGSYLKVGYSNGWSTRNHAVDARSPEAIDFTGVKDVYLCYDHKTGSTAWDDGAIVISNSDPLSDGDRECSWMKNKSNCDHWGMTNIGSDHITRTMSLSDRSKQYIYLVAHKGGFMGSCYVRFHNYNGNANCSTRLNLQDYDVSIVDPEPIKLFKNGKLESVKAVTNAQFTDPNRDTANYTTRATFYRYDTTAFKAAIDSQFGKATLKGVYMVNPDDHNKRSSLISLINGQFTLSPDILRGYSNFIYNNKIYLQPCYEFDTVEFTVESYEDAATGVKFTVDNRNHKGTFTVGGHEYGTLSWSYDGSRDRYYDGDEVKFIFKPGTTGTDNSVALEYRSADIKSDLSSAQWNKTGTGKNETVVTIKNRYFSVKPYILATNAKTRLIVKNPDKGSFTSKDTKYAAKNSDGSVVVTGFKTDKLDQSFENASAGTRLDFTAKPSKNYYCVWSYTDTVTHKAVTLRGDNFYYVVQNATNINDNTVVLSFETNGNKTDDVLRVKVAGKLFVPDSTILHPATATTTLKQPAANATVYMDGFVGQTDSNGQFTLKDTNDQEAKVPFASYTGSDDRSPKSETHRALILYNGNFYISDVTLTITPNSQMDAKPEITINTSSNLGVQPKGATAYSTDAGTYGDTITLVTSRSVRFAVDFDARNVSADKPVNLARWIFVGSNGIERSTTEIPVDKGSSTAYLDAVVTEKAKQGDSLFVEFYNKGFDNSSNEKRTFYGRFEVGYHFVNANVQKVMSYMPDIGYYDDDSHKGDAVGAHYSKIPSAPAIGPISPLFSIYGFMPIYSDAATGQKDQKTGKDLYCLEIGVQFSIAKTDTKDKAGKWSTSSVAKQYEKLAGIIDKTPGELAQGLQTSTKISVTVTFAYQLEYYTADGGARHYTASLFLLGGKIGVRISIPFTIVAIPCFVYFDISADNIGYLVHMPNNKTEGYWTDKMLSDSYYYDTHGEFTQNFVIKFGVGVGFDGLASIGGHVDFGLVSRISGSTHGKMTCSVSGGVTAELLFLKVDKTWKIAEKVLLDTDAKLSSVAENLLGAQNEDLLGTKLGDMKLDRASDIYDDSVVADKKAELVGADGKAVTENEVYLEKNTASMKPVIGKISDTRYMIANILDNERDSLCLRAFIYDSETEQVVEKINPVEQISKLATITDEEKNILARSEDLVADIDVVDCGDKLLLLWEGCAMDYSESVNVSNFLKSIKVMGALYDKKTGKFTDFNIIDNPGGRLPDKIHGVYSPETGTVHVFFQSIDVEGVDSETTLRELNQRPISMGMSSTSVKDGELNFSKASQLDTKGKTISDYSVITSGDKVLLSYVSADSNTRIVEQSLTEKDYDKTQYGTKNLMVLNRYKTNEKGELTAESSLEIADEEHVTANPEFVTLSYKGDKNTLLFYKCNGRYGYQNVDDLYLQCDHYGWKDAIPSEMMDPAYITVDEDHTVGEDLTVYPGNDGSLYALWTLSEGDQQQIWGREFEVDEIIEEDTVVKIDSQKEVIYNTDGSPQTEQLSKPIHILRGYWGNKVRLTTGGLKTDDIGTGYYKGNFDAIDSGDNQLLGAYEVFDYDFGDEEEGDLMLRINNRFVISEFNLSPLFEACEDAEDTIQFSNDYPNPGEVVQVDIQASNNGFRNGKDVTINLKRTGSEEIIDSVTYPVWLAGEDIEESFIYTAPDDIATDNVELYYEVIDDGKVMFRCKPKSFIYAPRLSIELAHADPEALFDGENDAVPYHVSALIVNTGNAPYNGGDELNFINNDLAAQADVMNKNIINNDPFYQNFGGIEIPEIGVGSSVELGFVSDEIPESVFDKYHTNSANLKLAITPMDGIGWEEVKGDEPYYFIDELGIGQFVKPVPEKVTAISAEPVEIALGDTEYLLPTVTPPSAADTAELHYSSSDNKVVTVDENGILTPNKAGTAIITISCGDVKTEVTVTVKPSDKNLLGDANLDGQVDITDATIMQLYAAEMTELSDLAKRLADVNSDGNVTVADVTQLQNYLAGVNVPYPIGETVVIQNFPT